MAVLVGYMCCVGVYPKHIYWLVEHMVGGRSVTFDSLVGMFSKSLTVGVLEASGLLPLVDCPGGNRSQHHTKLSPNPSCICDCN